MEAVSDVIVIGGGPCGSFAALNLARLGVTTTVFEEHAEIGVPSHCTGHLSLGGLKALGLHPLPDSIVENTFCGATFHSALGSRFSVRLPSPTTCVINRVRFDKFIANRAQEAGVHYFMNSKVESLIIEDGLVKCIAVNQNNEIRRFQAKVVIDAEGISSHLLRKAGLPTLDRSKLVNGVEAEIENVKDMQSDTVEILLSKQLAPGFYGWLVPKNDGKAKIGLAASVGSPRELLQRLILGHPTLSAKLRDARILQIGFHPISLGGPIPKVCSRNFLAIGDAASHVKPTTGGGVVLGMTCARIAAEVVAQALHKEVFSPGFLSEYGKKCGQLLGFDMNVMLRFRAFLNRLSDDQIDKAISFCASTGVDKALQSVENIDFQGKSLVRLLRKPRVLTALLYFLGLYVSANP